MRPQCDREETDKNAMDQGKARRQSGGEGGGRIGSVLADGRRRGGCQRAVALRSLTPGGARERMFQRPAAPPICRQPNPAATAATACAAIMEATEPPQPYASNASPAAHAPAAPPP